MPATSAKNASTVILVREASGGSFQVLMTRRPGWMDFLGGFYVFPGGIVEQQDLSRKMFARCRGLTPSDAKTILGSDLPPDVSLAHWIAAVRELFEECGILLGVTDSGEPVRLNEDGRKQEFERKRKELVNGMMTFADIITDEGLYCDMSRLIYFMHRVTPEQSSMRFDTRFYLSCLPSGQTPLAESEEVAESVWIAPKEALERLARGEMPLIRPTRIVLESLAGLQSWQRLCTHYRLLTAPQSPK